MPICDINCDETMRLSCKHIYDRNFGCQYAFGCYWEKGDPEEPMDPLPTKVNSLYTCLVCGWVNECRNPKKHGSYPIEPNHLHKPSIIFSEEESRELLRLKKEDVERRRKEDQAKSDR